MLLTLIFLPLLGIFIIMTSANTYNKNKTFIAYNNKVALSVSLLTFIFSLKIWADFDSSLMAYQFSSNVLFKLGVDGISLYFILLTTFLIPICILCY